MARLVLLSGTGQNGVSPHEMESLMSAEVILWSVVGLIGLVGGVGLVAAIVAMVKSGYQG